MAGAAAQQTTQSLEQLWESLEFGIPDTLKVSEMLLDQQVRLRAANFIGETVMRSGAEMSAETSGSITCLHDAIHEARRGNQQARALVESNAGTDVIERTIKTGHVMKPVELTVTDDSTVMQHGQTMDDIQANSLRYAADHPIMWLRSVAETHNAFRTQELHKAGFFEDYSLVVISRAENLPDAGFFTETMSCAIQVTAKQGDGLAIETAFVAGIATPGGEQHDEATTVALGAELGVDLTGKTPAEIIDTPILVHNSLIPNGAIDLVKLWDDCAGGTFFGEAKPKQDYLEYLAYCRQRELGFKPKIQNIVDDLLNRAADISSPLRATEMLHKLSEGHMVEYAVQDESIDVRVFGAVAAPQIELARLARQHGDMQAMDAYTQKAKDTAQSNSCPGGIRTPGSSADEATPDKAESDEDCYFISKKCPMCGAKNVKTKVTKTHIIGKCGCRKAK